MRRLTGFALAASLSLVLLSTAANAAAISHYGFSREQLLGMSLNDLQVAANELAQDNVQPLVQGRELADSVLSHGRVALEVAGDVGPVAVTGDLVQINAMRVVQNR